MRPTGAGAPELETRDVDAGDGTMTILNVINAGVDQRNLAMAKANEVAANRQSQAAQADKTVAQAAGQMANAHSQGIAHSSEGSARALESIDKEHSRHRLLAPNFRGAIFNAQLALSAKEAAENTKTPTTAATAQGSADASTKVKQNP